MPVPRFLLLGAAVGALGVSGTAHASEGPWTTAPGLHNLYFGAFYEQFSCFTFEGAQTPDCPSGAAAVEAPIRRVGAKGFYRTGLSRWADVAVSVPVVRASSAATAAPYATTLGVGSVQARLRARLGSLGPVDLSGSVGVETGALHQSTRGRITNIGDGVTSVLGTVSAGSTGLLGRSFYTASVDAAYAYRIPEADEAVGRIPADEVRVASAFLYGLSDRFGIGASLDGQFRLWGEDLDFAALASYGGADDSLRWTSLNASQVKAGARLAMYPVRHWPYLQVSIHRSIWAENNPVDTTFVEAAVGFDLGTRKEDR